MWANPRELNLGAAARMRDHVANLRQNAGALHAVELLGEHRHFGDEWIGQQLVDLIFARRAASE